MRDAPAQNLVRLRQLFPGLTEAKYASLDAWYAGYAALILRMYERITGDPAAYAAHVGGHSAGSGHHHLDDGAARAGHVIGAAPLDPAPRKASS